jgi:hypothetical protein
MLSLIKLALQAYKFKHFVFTRVSHVEVDQEHRYDNKRQIDLRLERLALDDSIGVRDWQMSTRHVQHGLASSAFRFRWSS